MKFWIIAGVGISSLIGISNASRRLRDILGREDKTINLIVSVIIIISAFALLVTHNIFTYILFISHLIIQLILLFKKGKATSELPYDSMREFNWVACITTWLWGLFNKSYITLFNLILFLTLWGVLFQIYCGLKGNEWALKNKKWENIEQFNKSQEKQTVFLVIFQVLMHFVVIPVIFFIFMMFCFAQYINPHGMKIVFNGMEKTLKIIDGIADLVYFESYEINKFYIYPTTWNYYSFEERQKILNHAVKLSANKKDKKAGRIEKQDIIRQAAKQIVLKYNLIQSTVNYQKLKYIILKTISF